MSKFISLFGISPISMMLFVLITCSVNADNSNDKSVTKIEDFSYDSVLNKNGHVVEKPETQEVILINNLDSLDGVSYALTVSGAENNFEDGAKTTFNGRTKLNFNKVTFPAIDSKGIVRISPDTTAGSYVVIATKGKKRAKARFYVAITPTTKGELNAAIKDGIERYGNDADLNYINTSEITDMACLFSKYFNDDCIYYFAGTRPYLDGFNGDISLWDVSQVTDMDVMFFAATAFNRKIGDWHVSKVTKMENMFYDASSFNQDIISWNVSEVTTMKGMFSEASVFSQDLEAWNVASDVPKVGMFDNSGVSAAAGNLPCWYDNTQPKCDP